MDTKVYLTEETEQNLIKEIRGEPNVSLVSVDRRTRQARIREFTEATSEVATRPRVMEPGEVDFLVKMNCEELMELLATVYPAEKVLDILRLLAGEAKKPVPVVNKTEIEVISAQVDALVDIDYFNGNAASKVGWDMDDVFDEVHDANMRKRHPDGTFRKVDGKVSKPPGWTPPDVEKVVKSWMA